MVPVPQGRKASLPSSFLAGRTSQLAGLARTAANQLNALRINPFPVRQLDYSALAAGGGGGGGDLQLNPATWSQADFERGNLEFASQLGMSGEQALAAAQAHAPSYQGVQFIPHNIAQEGHVEYRGDTPGIYVKFSAPGQGSSTEWVPLG